MTINDVKRKQIISTNHNPPSTTREETSNFLYLRLYLRYMCHVNPGPSQYVPRKLRVGW